LFIHDDVEYINTHTLPQLFVKANICRFDNNLCIYCIWTDLSKYHEIFFFILQCSTYTLAWMVL